MSDQKGKSGSNPDPVRGAVWGIGERTPVRELPQYTPQNAPVETGGLNIGPQVGFPVNPTGSQVGGSGPRPVRSYYLDEEDDQFPIVASICAGAAAFLVCVIALAAWSWLS